MLEPEHFSYLGIFIVLVLIGLGLPLPEDLPLLSAGVLIHEGVMTPVPALVVCYAGIMIGDAIIYHAGRIYGRQIVETRMVRRYVSPERLEEFEGRFERWGGWALFFGRFLPGFRAAAFLSSGILRYPFSRFLLVNGLAALLSVPLWVGIGYTFAENMEAIRGRIAEIEHWIILALVVLVTLGGVVWWYRSLPHDRKPST